MGIHIFFPSPSHSIESLNAHPLPGTRFQSDEIRTRGTQSETQSGSTRDHVPDGAKCNQGGDPFPSSDGLAVNLDQVGNPRVDRTRRLGAPPQEREQHNESTEGEERHGWHKEGDGK